MFSFRHYLDELLPAEAAFSGVAEEEIQRIFGQIRSLWDTDRFPSLNESQFRKHFLDKVFEILGWTADVEPPIPYGEWTTHPDYALFESKNALEVAQEAPKEGYFKNALCIGEAKRWGRSLDKKVKTDLENAQNPSLQISQYLWLSEVRWGILTDGRYWRLYERETSKKLDVFYEIDLKALIEEGSSEDFKFFVLFFSQRCFSSLCGKGLQGKY